MGIERLKRVIWRLEGLTIVNRTALTKAIMEEIGTDKQTIERNIDAMQKLRLLKRLNKHQWRIIDDQNF